MPLLAPIVSSSLPTTTPGPHKRIGYTYLRHKSLNPYTRPSPTFQSTKAPVFQNKEVGYAVFYPCEGGKSGWLSSGRGVGWFPDPVGSMTKGYAKFLGKSGLGWLFAIMRVIVGRIKMPVYPDSPVAAPMQDKKYPLIIFSHGLAGTRTTYSQYCSALASEGYVVLAVEHRDGSAPAVTIDLSPDTTADKSAKADNVLLYTKHPELDWAGESNSSLMRLRTLQLEMRVREVYDAYHNFRQVVEADGDAETSSVRSLAQDKLPWLASIRDRVDFDETYMTGHSFGGGTTLSVLQTAPPEGFDRIPIRKAIALDPWLEPLPMPSDSGRAHDAMPPILVINSPGFTVWDDHFRRLMGVISDAEGWLTTIIGANHQSFSDFPLLVPPTSSSLKLLRNIHDISLNFIKGNLAASPLLEGKSEVKGNFERNQKGKMSGSAAEIILHLKGKQ